MANTTKVIMRGWSSSGCQLVAERRRDARAEQLDCAHQFVVGQGAGVHLEREARHSAECFAVAEDLLDDFIGTADQQRALRTPLCVEAFARDGRPAALTSDVGERPRVAGKEFVSRLFGGRCDVAQRMDADLEPIGWMSGALSRFAIQSDQGTEPFRLTSDDGDHQRQSEHPGSNERRRSSAHAEPDRQRILQRSWIYSLTRQRWPEPAGPRDLLVVTNLQQ